MGIVKQAGIVLFIPTTPYQFVLVLRNATVSFTKIMCDLYFITKDNHDEMEFKKSIETYLSTCYNNELEILSKLTVEKWSEIVWSVLGEKKKKKWEEKPYFYKNSKSLYSKHADFIQSLASAVLEQRRLQIDGNEIIINKRSIKVGKLKYADIGFAKGYVEHGEDFLTAAKRETCEELKIEEHDFEVIESVSPKLLKWLSQKENFEANFYLAKLTCGLDKLKANTVIPADFTLDRYRTMQHEDSNTFILPVEDAFKSLPDDFPERHELLTHFHNIIQNLFPPSLTISSMTKSTEIVTPKISNSNELKLVAVTKSSEPVKIDVPKDKPLDEKYNKHEYRSRSRERHEKEVNHSHGQHSSSHDDRTKDNKQKEKHSLHNRKRSRSRSRERDRNWSYDSNYSGHYNSKKRSRHY